MTEDEVFIRAIVDSPGDDTPRLVYADWLDDRDDPRGPYLRAEREAVVTGNVAKLRGLARELDPVWVARVSHPPVGACIEHTELVDRGLPIHEADLAALEQRHGIALPADYQAFMLNYNGGWFPWEFQYETPDGEIVRTNELGWRLHSLDRVKPFVPRSDDVLHGDYGLPPLLEPIESWLARFLYIGHNPDWIGGLFLGVASDDFGHVRILDTSVEIEVGIRHHVGRPPYAPTFADFLEYLPRYRPQAE